jgi:hypothetical protein
MKTIRHKWQPQPGFRVHRCSKCGVIRQWREAWGCLVYLRNWTDGIIRTFAPDCVLPNTKIK